MKKVKKIVENIMFVICVALALWFIISFVEVDMKNLTENPVYNSWNFFEVFLKILMKT